MDAQLTGYVEGDLSFQAHGDYDSTDNAFHYRFGAYLFYNLGFKAKAQVLNFINWALSARAAYNPRRTVKLYDKQGTIPMSSTQAKRDEIIDVSANYSSAVANHTSFHPSTDMKLFHRSDEMDLGMWQTNRSYCTLSNQSRRSQRPRIHPEWQMHRSQ